MADWREEIRRKANEEAEYYNRGWNTNWAISTPLSQLPRRVRTMVRERSIDATIVLAQAILGFTPISDTFLALPCRGASNYGTAPSLNNVNALNINWREIMRSGGGAKEVWGRHYGPLSFHHILDPNGGPAGWSPIMNDLILMSFAAGHGRAFFGSCEFNTAADETSLVGVGWRTNDVDGYWTTFLRDGTTTPSNVVHENGYSSITSTVPRRLATVLNAATKSIDWYADGELVESYTPVATLSQMGAVPKFGFFGVTNAGADTRIRTVGGGNPRLLVLSPVA